MVEALWERWQPNPELIGSDKGELWARVFLPYSSLTWANPKRSFHALNDYYQQHGSFPKEFYEDDDWEAKDENGNLLPGNMTDEIYWAVHHCLPIWRLNDIKQLSFLDYAPERKEQFWAKGPGFNHSRMEHVDLTAIVTKAILENNGFSKTEVNQGTIAAFCHDLATPAFGDPTKEIDPEVLDEEVAIARMFDKYELSPLEKYGFDKERVQSIIRNEGTIGKLLDIADKIVYTAVDLKNYAGSPFQREDFGPPLDATIEAVRNLLRSDPYWADIYKEVKIDQKGEPYFQDAERLATFLELRARMHKALYLNPKCRGLDMLYKMLLFPLYSRNPNPNFPLNPDNLLLYTDYELGKVIGRHWRLFQDIENLEDVLDIMPDYQEILGIDQIDSVMNLLVERGELVIGSETIRRFNGCQNSQTIDPKTGEIKPFYEVNPARARYIQEIVEECHRTVVYYWPKKLFPESKAGDKLRPVISKVVESIRQKNNGKLPHHTLY